MGVLLDRTSIKKLTSVDVIKNTNTFKKGKVNKTEFNALIRGYFFSVFDIRRSSFSDIYFGGDIFLKRRRNDRYYKFVNASEEKKYLDTHEKNKDVWEKIEALRKLSKDNMKRIRKNIIQPLVDNPIEKNNSEIDKAI